MLLAHQPVPAGRRVAVVSNGGGPGIVAADACAAAGLQVPELSSELQGALRALAPSGGVQNPVDLIAAAGADVFERAVGLLLASGEIDALIAIYVAPYVTHAPEIEAAVVRATAATPDIPVAACLLGLDDPPSVLPVPGRRGVPTFAYPEAAAQALARAAWLGEWRQRPVGTVAPIAVDHAAVETRVTQALADAPPEGWVPPDVAFGVLADAGIPVVRSTTVTSAADAMAAADAMGFPIALKAVAPGLVHKSDVGGVRLGLADGDAVRAAYHAMGEALEGTMTGAVVQPMVPPGVELIVGIRNDTAFGPVVVLGMGGVTAELQHDVALSIPPLTDVDIDELIRALRGSPLLFGYRNAPPVDVARARRPARPHRALGRDRRGDRRARLQPRRRVAGRCGRGRRQAATDATTGAPGPLRFRGTVTTSAPWAALAETHSAIVVFTGDRAYKLKKPVKFDFLDFSTRERREEAAHREVALNRRLAPDVYLGVADVLDVDGAPCDHLVVMRRMPADRRLSALVAAGAATDDDLRELARLLVRFHAAAARTPATAAAGSPGVIAAKLAGDVAELQPFRGGILAADTLDEVGARAHALRGGPGPALRTAAGRRVGLRRAWRPPG